MKYSIRGKNKTVKFTQNDFIGKGGQGSTYRIGDLVYKIYTDPSTMIPEAKIEELSVIKDPDIIKPLDIILDPRNIVTGYTMKYVNGESICKFFTSDFRNRNNITDDQTLELVENIKSKTYLVHHHKFLLIDGNEFNYMVDGKDFVTPYFIDIDGWQTLNFPATVIMPSIRDWAANKFSEITDWFSFAVVTFQLFVGIHPFKGKIKGYKKNDFSKRVIDCVSVLNSKVRIPPAARDFGLIPSYYRDWYYDLFEKGKRIKPPDKAGTRGPVTTRHTVIQSTDSFEVKEIEEFDSDIVFNANRNGINITKTKKKIHINHMDYRVSKDVEVIFTPKMQYPIFVKVEDGLAKLQCPLKDVEIKQTVNLKCEDKMIIDDTLYLKNGSKLVELKFFEHNNQVFSAVHKTWGIMKNSSQLFSGVIYQSIFGRAYLVFPKPNPQGNSGFHISPVPELDDFRIVGAKHENGVCVVLAHKNHYCRFVFSFDKDKYSYRVTDDVDLIQPNFTVLDNGIAIMITDDDRLEIFKKSRSDVKEIIDTQINSSMQLTRSGVQARFFKGNKLFSIRMK